MIAVLIVFLAADKKRNLMKKVSKRDSDKTETRLCNCWRRDSKESRHTKEQDRNIKSTRKGVHGLCTAVIALSNFRMLIRELLNKDPDIFSEESPLTILDIKSAFCMSNNGKYTN